MSLAGVSVDLCGSLCKNVQVQNIGTSSVGPGNYIPVVEFLCCVSSNMSICWTFMNAQKTDPSN